MLLKDVSFVISDGGVSPCDIDAIFSAAANQESEAIEAPPPMPWTLFAELEYF